MTDADASTTFATVSNTAVASAPLVTVTASTALVSVSTVAVTSSSTVATVSNPGPPMLRAAFLQLVSCQSHCSRSSESLNRR